jgi:hypothetical protein
MQQILKTVLPALAIVAAMMATTLFAQGASAPQRPALPNSSLQGSALEIAFTYQGTRSNEINSSGFWLQGGAAQIHGQFYGGWGAVADITGARVANINSSGVGLDLVTATFGPRYTWKPEHGRYSVYGQGLLGQAWGMNSVFPSPSGANTVANSMAIKAGGGMNLNLKPHLALRLFEADYLRTQLPNATDNVQNYLTIGAGIVLQFR